MGRDPLPETASQEVLQDPGWGISSVRRDGVDACPRALDSSAEQNLGSIFRPLRIHTERGQLPLGPTDAIGVSAMVNLIGAMPDRADVLAIPGAHLHDYGKEPRPGRKLGHITVRAMDEPTLETRMEAVAAACA